MSLLILVELRRYCALIGAHPLTDISLFLTEISILFRSWLEQDSAEPMNTRPHN